LNYGWIMALKKSAGLYTILPRIGQQPKLDNIVYSPADFFNAMYFELWMDNGMAIPASAQALHQIKQTTQS